MIYDRELLDRLDQLRANPWRGEVFRHMFGDYPPERENQRGARWNPPETPAIYTSLTRDVVLAEAEFHIALQPVRPTGRRIIYRIGVVLGSVADLSMMRQQGPADLSAGVNHFRSVELAGHPCGVHTRCGEDRAVRSQANWFGERRAKREAGEDVEAVEREGSMTR
ncbi:MAG: RES family NAD+ phosphorylase [Candidatus Rokubacteria bacterium]|nr:RES family NAD+ phosphorylase [Candidatus Rokubacteria bacterium]